MRFLLILLLFLPTFAKAECRLRYYEEALQKANIVVYGRLFVVKNKRLQGQVADTYSGTMFVYETLKGKKQTHTIVLNVYSVDYYYKPNAPSFEPKTGVFCLFFDNNKKLSFAEASRCAPPNFAPVINGCVSYRSKRNGNELQTLAKFKKTMKNFL